MTHTPGSEAAGGEGGAGLCPLRVVKDNKKLSYADTSGNRPLLSGYTAVAFADNYRSRHNSAEATAAQLALYRKGGAMILKAKILLLILVICFPVLIVFAQPTQQTSSEKLRREVRNYVERRNKARQRRKDLALLFNGSKSRPDIKDFIGKEIILDAVLVKQTAHMLTLKGENGVTFRVKTSQEVKLPLADSYFLTVLGRVERISREDSVVTVRLIEIIGVDAD